MSTNEDTFIFFVERNGFCKIGYTKKDLEKIAFYFQNRNILAIILSWVKFKYFRRKAYE